MNPTSNAYVNRLKNCLYFFSFRYFVSAFFILAFLGAFQSHAFAQSQANLTPQERMQLSRVNVFFNTLKTLEGNFIQIDPRGREAKGRFYISRPGSLRFQYTSPQNSAVVADGNWVAIQDDKGKFIDRYPLISTPLRFLLQDKVNLDQDANIEAVLSNEYVLSITLSGKTAATPGKLTLNFALPDYRLDSWAVLDAQGQTTRVAVGDLEYGKTYNRSMFRIVENRVFNLETGRFE